MKRTKSKKPRQAVVVAPPSQVETEEKTVVWQHEAAFQADDFSCDVLLSSVVSQILDAQSAEPDHEPYAFEHLDALSKCLQSLHVEVLHREQELQLYAAELAGQVAAEEEAHQAALARLVPTVEALHSQFGSLDGRVARVGRTAAHVGDRLQVVDTTRARAEQAAALISSLALFDTPDEPVLGALFTDDSRLSEAATLTARLIQLAETGAGAGLAGCARAAERLQTYSNSLENRLVRRFDEAEAARDVPEMANAAGALVRFNGGATLMARFVSSRRIFSQLGPADDALLGLGEEAALQDGITVLPASETEAGEQAAASLRRLGAHFKELLRAAKEEAALAVRVFGDVGGGCAAQLVRRLLEQRVGMALERALEPSRRRVDAERVSSGLPNDTHLRLSRLLLLAGAAERVSELGVRLSQLPGCGVGGLDVAAASGELFTQWREGYLEEELSVQDALADGGAGSFEGAEARLARAPDAIARAALLLLAPRAIAHGVARLCAALCESVASQLVAGLEAESAHSAGLCRAHSAALPAAQVVAEGAGMLLSAVGRAAAVAQLLHAHLAEHAAPLLAADKSAVTQGAAAARASGVAIESALCSALLQAAAAGASGLERMLQGQAKADFAPRALGLTGGANDAANAGLGADMPTVACMRVMQFARLVHAASAPLNARNRAALCVSLATRLVAALEAHCGRFSYTPAGGLRLRRDLEEYCHLLEADFALPESAEQLRRLAELRALAALLVAPPMALTALVNGEGLGVAVRREEAIRWLSLRADYHRTERPFRQLTV